MKSTIFCNNDHTHIIISDLDITPEECKTKSNTFTLPSPHNTSVLEKTTKLLRPNPMTFIHHTISHAWGTAKNQLEK